jgi:hypothetical protein
MKLDADLAIRAGGLQAILVMILALVLAILFSHEFFESWGWVAGPAAWLACAAFVAWRLTLPYFPALMGAAIAGLPSLLAVALGLHWAGAAVGVVVFGLWCGTLTPLKPRVPRERRRPQV